MITLKRPTEAPSPLPERAPDSEARLARSGWRARLPAAALIAAILVSLSTTALFDFRSATALQKRADAMHAHWAGMREDGVAAAELATLEKQWNRANAVRLFGRASVFWLPGADEVIGRWQRDSDAIWARSMANARSQAIAADQALRDALGTEPQTQRKDRTYAIGESTTPREFITLRDEWTLAAKLVPIDRTVAARVATINAQSLRAGRLGIRSDPAPQAFADAAAFAQMSDSSRLQQSDTFISELTALQEDLQARLESATITSDQFQRTSNYVSIGSIYGINVAGLWQRIATSRSAYATSITAARFEAITADLKRVYSDADGAIRVVLRRTRIIGGISMIFQNHSLSCEEAVTSMALTHQGIHVSQDQLLRELGADLRPMYVDAQGRVRWGNPYKTFVGSVNGSESNYTGYGTFYPPLVRLARAHGAKILAYGTMSAATIYARLLAGHPVVVFSTWDWRWHPRHDYLSFDGRWVPWIGPGISSHVYLAVGVSPTRVLVNDPIRGQYWVSKAAFEAGYSDFREAIVFA